ncbi:hypothetical protein LWI29_037391 [Acer saccharum]|uniref:Uncharacterized protein n=1 Tax=Acer saccharum TaxID=4024 RepID=A0AA39VHA3_ACESA|nr:hypothetical protein LWI29_037391 [Acer saccharum]
MGVVECKSPLDHQIAIDVATDNEKFDQPIIIDDHVSKPCPHHSSSILTRLHAGYFRISISLGCQALLWKILSESKRDSQAGVLPSTVFHLLWWLAVITQASFSLLYVLKCFHHFHMVKAEFLHHVGVNYLYAPWISFLLLLQSSPVTLSNSVSYLVLCWVFAIPVIFLDLKIYGQWFTTEKRFLSIFANPTSQISVIANFVVAQAAAKMGWKETAVCMFSLGMVHYLVLFITLYQRLSGSHRFPSILRPAFFLFIAAPSMGSLAWNSISGAFDTTSKMLFFLSLFLFTSLACRPVLFKKSMRKFNVAWWAYSFSLTFLALASAGYAQEQKGTHAAPGLMLVLSALSVLVFLGLMLFTAANTNKLLYEDDPILNFVNNSKSKSSAAK